VYKIKLISTKKARLHYPCISPYQQHALCTDCLT